MKQLKEFAIGDVVKLRLIKDRTEYSIERFTPGTILAIEATRVLIGWSIAEPGAWNLYSSDGFDKKYINGLYFNSSITYADLIGRGQVSLKTLTDSQQWKIFQNNMPGECPCGTNRSVCKYHS